MLIKKIIVLVSFISLFFLISCTSNNIESLNTHEIPDFDLSFESVNDEIEIIEKSLHYEIIKSNLLYYCNFCNDKGECVKTDVPFTNVPDVIVVDNDLIRLSYTAGTGVGTQWGYYYDVKENMFSEVFYNIFDQNNGLIVYSDQYKVVIRDIFDKTKYYKEFSNFQYEFSDTVEPFVDIEFSNQGRNIKVTYLSGIYYQEKVEMFDY